MRRRAALTLVVAALVLLTGCKRSQHARVSSYTSPGLPAGFVEHAGTGWRVATPSTWPQTGKPAPGDWGAADPQAVDDYHANTNVVVEPFTGESYDYARASEASLRGKAHVTVLAAREDVVDGDPTMILESRWEPEPPATTAYQLMQTALASRGTGYVVTCSVAASSFERYRSTCEAIVRSFAVER
jgi:hypothetical protein